MTTFTREDFEMAAKAAGLSVKTWDGHTGTMCAIYDDHHGKMWMPPRDDGDALRLAVVLSMTVDITSAGVILWCDVIESDGESFRTRFVETWIQHGGNKLAATRVAIFRAAIAIGRAMP